MISSHKRTYYWMTTPRLDTKLLLRALIAFNIVIAIYNVTTLQANNKTGKSSPCVVVINTSKDAQNAQKISEREASHSNMISKDKVREEVTSMDNVIEILKGVNMPSQESTKDKSTNIWWTTQRRGSYSALLNYIPSEQKQDNNNSVTLTTQGTYEYLYHSEQLCRRWDGQLSIAVYAPGDDFQLVVNLIYFLRQCRNSCIAKRISWHLVYDTAYGPNSTQTFPESYVNDKFDCTQNTEAIIAKFKSSFRRDNSLPYPINVVRNVARISANTKYIFASDIELYPSVHIVSSFTQLMERERSGLVSLVSNDKPHVYVIPIFEVKDGVEPPFNKSQLRALVKSGNAIFFHKWVCDACQNFPDRDKWIQNIPVNNSLNIFRVTKRLRSRSIWEPLYIGTNAEPFYDERLTWDGKRDKMAQMYEMCLMNYDLAILDNAFLVHAPGIKRIDIKDERRRLPLIKRNNMVYNTIIAKLRKKYRSKNNC